MNKTLQKALIELVIFMAEMIVDQGNVFGTGDTAKLNEKINKLWAVWKDVS